MIKKLISIALIVLFIGGVTAVDAELKSQTSVDAAELRSGSDLGVIAETSVREKPDDGVCVLSIDSAKDAKLAIKCGVEEGETQASFLKATLESSGDRSEYSPESIAVVHDSGRCPDSRVCYKLESGSVDVRVVNNPPTTKASPIYEGDAVGGENVLNRGEMSNTISLVGFGSFSISKRSARTGPNPETDKEIQETPDDSDRAIANRVLASVESSDCPEYEGGERCIVEAIKDSEIYSDLSKQGHVEILMTLSADPLATPRSEGGGDCDDTDPVIRPEVCGKTTHFIDPDLDGDGLPDLALVQSGNLFNWTIDNETVAKTSVRKANAADSQVIFIQVESTAEAANKAELIDAIASNAGLSKADSKKALDAFIDTTTKVASKPECCFDYSRGTDSSEQSSGSAKEIDKATPKLYERLEEKDKRIEELERRIAELEADGNLSVNGEVSSENGNDRVVRKKPGRTVPEGDMGSDADGISDAEESADLETAGNSSSEERRPGFVSRLLGSIFG